MSGGYEDDQDFGDVIIYTGHGGRDPETGRQVADQTLTRWNQALARRGFQNVHMRLDRQVFAAYRWPDPADEDMLRNLLVFNRERAKTTTER